MSATLVVRDAISMCIALLKWSRRCTRKYRGTWNRARPIALLGLARRERISNKPSRCKICVAFPPQMEPRLDGKFQRTRNRFGKQGKGRGFGSGPESKFDAQDSESVQAQSRMVTEDATSNRGIAGTSEGGSTVGRHLCLQSC